MLCLISIVFACHASASRVGEFYDVLFAKRHIAPYLRQRYYSEGPSLFLPALCGSGV